MYSDAGDYIGGGTPRLFTPANGQIATTAGDGSVSVSVSGGTSGDAYTLEFAAPPGQALVPGVYDGAQRASFRSGGHPGIDISGDGRGCNTDTGRFEVRDLARAADGA